MIESESAGKVQPLSEQEYASSFPALRDPHSGTPVRYVRDPEFQRTDSGSQFESKLAPAESLTQPTGGPTEGSAYFSYLWSQPLLERHQETELFQKFNFGRFQVASLQRELASCRGHAGLLPIIARQWKETREIRNFLIERNLRLVVSIAKKYNLKNGLTLDDLISAGNTALLNSVESFDYLRGCRFGTYAYTAIRRSIFSLYQNELKREQRFVKGDNSGALEASIDTSAPAIVEMQAQESIERMRVLLETLGEREKTILMERFGFAAQASPKSFTEIGRSIGVSKQRVAAIFARTMRKLRSKLEQNNAQPACDSANA